MPPGAFSYKKEKKWGEVLSIQKLWGELSWKQTQENSAVG